VRGGLRTLVDLAGEDFCVCVRVKEIEAVEGSGGEEGEREKPGGLETL